MGRMQSSKRALAAPAFLALAALSACHTPNPISEPCPSFGILGDAEQATVFRGAGRDLTDIAYKVSLSNASLECHYDNNKKQRRQVVKGTLKVNILAERGPALSATTITVPYFVAVTRSTKYVLVRSEFSQTLDLKQGTRVGSEEEIPVAIPLAKDLKGDNYEVVVGIALTPEQLAYNRAQKAAH